MTPVAFARDFRKSPPRFKVVIQGSHCGPNCTVAVYELVDYRSGLTKRKAERWAMGITGAKRENLPRGRCALAGRRPRMRLLRRAV